MSKNFELLQEIGGDEELFRTLGSFEEVFSTVDAEPNADLDKEAREEVLRTSTLPSVWETSDASAVTRRRGAGRPPATSPDDQLQEQPAQEETAKAQNRAVRRPADRAGRQALSPVSPAARAEELRSEVSASRVKVSPEPQARPSFATTLQAERLPEKEELQPQESARWQAPKPGRGASAVIGEAAGKRQHAAQNRFFGSDLAAIATEEEVKLVQRLFPDSREGSARMALFSGLESKEGCAAICARTAELLAMRGDGPVCVVDANFQSPLLHRYFGAENVKGLLEATVETDPIQYYVQQIAGADLWLLPTGRSSEHLSFSAISDGLKARIDELRGAFEYVVIHAGPLRLETSGMLISRWTDGVVLVVEANSTRRDSAKKVKESLQAASVNLLGVVLNNRTFPIPEAIYRRL